MAVLHADRPRDASIARSPHRLEGTKDQQSRIWLEEAGAGDGETVGPPRRSRRDGGHIAARGGPYEMKAASLRPGTRLVSLSLELYHSPIRGKARFTTRIELRDSPRLGCQGPVPATQEAAPWNLVRQQVPPPSCPAWLAVKA